MKKALLGTLALLSAAALSAQSTIIYYDNFENTGNGMWLNTADLGSTTAGYNKWIVNNAYTGGSDSMSCMSIAFPYSVANTAQQPNGITGAPESSYLHIISNEAESDGMFCGSYLAADGLCHVSESNFSATGYLSTVNYSNVSFSFWWLCGGSADAYGEVYYSTDMGVTWTQCTGQLQYNNSSSSWTQATITDMAFNNQVNLRFGFRFVNNTTTTASDPGFCIDEMSMTGTLSTGIAPVTNGLSLNVLPNPSAENFLLSWSGRPASDRVTIRVCNLLGEVVREETQAFAEKMDLAAADLPAGVYMLSAQCGEQRVSTRLVKTN